MPDDAVTGTRPAPGRLAALEPVYKRIFQAAMALSRSDEGRQPHRARPSCGDSIEDRFKSTGAFRLPIEGELLA
ncbi:hypothetical protein [Streptomyces griseoaurantiacus]|uniref:hypothetical protein n=1 Tax=Streptomyces griseoaurantiacus TaxID=68213 RepID=UPI00379FC6CF